VLEEKETNPLLRSQIGEYREFIRSFVKQNAIMDKSFFIVVPYNSEQISSSGGGILGGLFGGGNKKKETLEKVEADVTPQLLRKIEQLNQRVEQVVSGLTQIGLRAVPLNDNELIDLFYNLYNPSSVEKKGVETGQESAVA